MVAMFLELIVIIDPLVNFGPRFCILAKVVTWVEFEEIAWMEILFESLKGGLVLGKGVKVIDVPSMKLCHHAFNILDL